MSMIDSETSATGRSTPFRLRATDVTGSLEMDVADLQPSVSAGAVARSLARLFELPNDVPWTLRDGERGFFLDEERPIGDQVATDARVVLTPKTHLG